MDDMHNVPAIQTGDPAIAIRTEGLTKTYGELTAVDGLDLEVRFGEVFGLLGPNGAGKTTIVRILSTLILADGGDVQVAGHGDSRTTVRRR